MARSIKTFIGFFTWIDMTAFATPTHCCIITFIQSDFRSVPIPWLAPGSWLSVGHYATVQSNPVPFSLVAFTILEELSPTNRDRFVLADDREEKRSSCKFNFGKMRHSWRQDKNVDIIPWKSEAIQPCGVFALVVGPWLNGKFRTGQAQTIQCTDRRGMFMVAKATSPG